MSQSMKPKKSYRVMSITDGYVCCSDAPGENWCGSVHPFLIEALVCLNRTRLLLAAGKGREKYRGIFRGQLIERADGHREVQAIQRSNHQLWSEIGSVVSKLPGYEDGVRRKVVDASGRTRYVKHPAKVFVRNVELLEAEIARLVERWGPREGYTLHKDVRGIRYASLEQLERENARAEARKGKAVKPVAPKPAVAKPAPVAKRTPRARRAA